MKDFFNNIIKNNTLAHAYLLIGNGKELAQWITQCIFCKEKTGCGNCANCRRIEHGNHPDVHFVAPDGKQIKVDQIRELQREGALKAVEGLKQVFIIDSADKMNEQAANALLKSLEEPLQDTLFLLIAENKNRILPTILSRVQQVKIEEFNTLAQDLENASLSLKYTNIYIDANFTLEIVELYKDSIDTWVELILSTLSQDTTHALLSIQTTWDKVFSDRETKFLAVELMQSYVRSACKKKRGMASIWPLDISYEWEQLIRLEHGVNDLQKALNSNGHFLLALENFIFQL